MTRPEPAAGSGGQVLSKLSWPSPRARRIATAIAGLAVAYLMLHGLLGGGRELRRAARLLVHPVVGWLFLAAACELLSYIAYAAAQRRLARGAGQRLEVWWLARLSVAAQALNNFLPAGYLAANVLNFRELRRRGLRPPTTAWLLVMTSGLYIGVLVVLAGIGSQLAGAHGGATASDLRLAALALLGLVAITWLAVTRLRRRGRLTILERMGAELVEVPRRELAAAAGVFASSWLADLACLVSAFLAVGATPPWTILLVAYAGAQLASFLPITPGGLGLVEGSLLLTLHPAGGGATVLAAVILYRIFSYWAMAPVGALAYLSLRRGAAARERLAGLATASPSVPLAVKTAS